MENRNKRSTVRRFWLYGLRLLLIVCANLSLYLQADAMLFSRKQALATDSITAELNRQLLDPTITGKMNYPISVRRFYKANGMQANWLAEETNIGPTASAMLLLDCVRQYGLQRERYHPEILTYSNMYAALAKKSGYSASNKVLFEVMLTDAVISMINHLHYGIFNPVYNLEVLENDPTIPIRPDELLLGVAKSTNLMYAIIDVQPRISQYQQLQAYMKLITGQYVCDSYEVPEQEIRAIAVNMERLRWTATEADAHIEINIPSFQLTYTVVDSIYVFKVMVGKPSTPTPVLLSQISYIETSPDWNIPHQIFIHELLPKARKDANFFSNTKTIVYNKRGNLVRMNAKNLKTVLNQPSDYDAKQTACYDQSFCNVVFHFSNPSGIYLHDTPRQQYFSRRNRALSHGCISVEHAAEFAKLVLAADGQANRVKPFVTAMKNERNQKFLLRFPLAIAITYQTIMIEKGLPVYYDDLYHQDEILETKLFGVSKQDNTESKK